MYIFYATDVDNLQQQVGMMRLLASQLELKNSREIEVFRTTRGIYYGVLEMGGRLVGKMFEYPMFFPVIRYDDRVDVDGKTKDIALEIVDHIQRKMFSSIEIVS